MAFDPTALYNASAKDLNSACSVLKVLSTMPLASPRLGGALSTRTLKLETKAST